MKFSSNEEKGKNVIFKFIADSGATEHISNSRLIFETLNNKDSQVIKCANKEVGLNTEGSGERRIRSGRGGEFVLSNVLYSNELSENLLSLRQFVDRGLQIFLDNRRINIYDPKSKEKIISGNYKSPFWIVKLKVLKETNERLEIENPFALVADSSTGIQHNTRSKSKTKIESENKEKLENENCIKEQGNNQLDNKLHKESDLLTTVNNRKFQITNSSTQLEKESESRLGLSKTMLWHLRLGHISNKYLGMLTNTYPSLPNKGEFMSDKNIVECETCLITKSMKLHFGKVRDRAEKPLQIIHADTMGPISRVSHPSRFKFVVVFIDDYSRTALAYPIRQKSEVPK